MPFDPVSRHVKQEAEKRCLEAAQQVADEIRSNPMTPVGPDATHLRASYHGDAIKGGAMLRCDVPYWHFVEFGTRYMPAEPHVRPSIELVRRRNGVTGR